VSFSTITKHASYAFINIASNLANVVNNSKSSTPRCTSCDSMSSQLFNFDILFIIRNLLQSTRMIRQQSITSRRNGETTSRSPLCSINLDRNMADMSQVTSSSSSHSKESAFEKRRRLQVELAADDEELKLAASDDNVEEDIIVSETVDTTGVSQADMLQLDVQVAREREAELTQHSNPQATAQSNGEAVAYADQGSDPFEESSDEEVGDPFFTGFAGDDEDAKLVTVASYELIVADANRHIVTQGSNKDDFRVDYDKLTENLSPGQCKFKVYFYSILII
jgi:hypothetical protein